MRSLVVDDETALVRQLQTMLTAARYLVDTAPDGEAARKYNMDSIDVRIITADRRYGAALLDLSVGGVGVLLAVPLQVNLPIGVELQIGQYTVAALGQVITVMSQAGRYRLGLCFLHLDPAERELLRLLDAPAKRA